jgi:adenine-specific DNA-methyltransferase
VLFTERVFPGVQEEVVLLLAEGYSRTPSGFCELHEVCNADDLARSSGVFRPWTPLPVEGRWSPSLLPAPALAAYLEVQESGHFTLLETWGKIVHRGYA